MTWLETVWDLFVNLDQYLQLVVSAYAAWTYGLLFLVTFGETGLLVMAFLPTDSLIFTAGSLAAAERLNLAGLFVTLTGAAVLGDTANYAWGRLVGTQAVQRRWIQEKNLAQAQRFFAQYGVQAILLSRFLPVTRALVPFVCGMGAMGYGRFLPYNLLSGVIWISLYLLTGYFFGGVPLVRDNFGTALMLVAILSYIPALVELWRVRRRAQREAGME